MLVHAHLHVHVYVHTCMFDLMIKCIVHVIAMKKEGRKKQPRSYKQQSK